MFLRNVAVALTLAVAGLFIAASTAEAARAIATGNVNVRTGPGTQYRAVGRMIRGERVRITRCNRNGSWCRINRNRGADGWVGARYLSHRGVGGRYRPWDGANRPGGFDVCFHGANGRICLGR